MEDTTAKRLGEILNTLQETAVNKTTQSSEWWLDHAQTLATLWLSVTKDLVKYEQLYKIEIVDRIEQGDSVAKATLVVEARSENYKVFRYLKKKSKQVEEIIKLAKKRVELENKYR